MSSKNAGDDDMVRGIEAGDAVFGAPHKRVGFATADVLRRVGRQFDRWLDLPFIRKIWAGP